MLKGSGELCYKWEPRGFLCSRWDEEANGGAANKLFHSEAGENTNTRLVKQADIDEKENSKIASWYEWSKTLVWALRSSGLLKVKV
jgi:hypothetical protein